MGSFVGLCAFYRVSSLLLSLAVSEGSLGILLRICRTGLLWEANYENVTSHELQSG